MHQPVLLCLRQLTAYALLLLVANCSLGVLMMHLRSATHVIPLDTARVAVVKSGAAVAAEANASRP